MNHCLDLNLVINWDQYFDQVLKILVILFGIKLNIILGNKNQLELHEKNQFTIALWSKLKILPGIILDNLLPKRLEIEYGKKLGSLFGIKFSNKVGSLLWIERGKVFCALFRIRFGSILGNRLDLYLVIALGTEL